jgi:5-methylcytosine-specific restriction enzyme subunit McrC
MRLHSGQITYNCEEHGEIAVPLSELIVSGRPDIYPEVSGRGFFDIDYSGGRLVLRATNWVGLIPISDAVAIHVRPKVAIGSLLWMLWRAQGLGARYRRLDRVLRSYREQPGIKFNGPHEVYQDAFLQGLQELSRHGVLKRYRSRVDDRELRGKLDVSRSIERFYARGVRFRHVFELTELTADNPENRIVKRTAQKVLFGASSIWKGSGDPRLVKARSDFELLHGVNDEYVTDETIVREVPRLLRALPGAYSHYEPLLWLAYLVALRRAVALEELGRARFDSVLLDVSKVFEDYVRAVLNEAKAELGCEIRSGNDSPLLLFTEGRSVQVKPDVYFVAGERTLMVADAKYMVEPSREDRYEVLAHCEATAAKRAVFICPRYGNDAKLEHYGTTRRGVRFHILRIDLSASDSERAEKEFVQQMRSLLEGAATAP